MSVQRGHLVDVRIKFEDGSSVFQTLKQQQRRQQQQQQDKKEDGENNEEGETTEEDGEKALVEAIYQQLETWSPIVDSIGESKTRAQLPSVPLHPIQCTREGKGIVACPLLFATAMAAI